MNISTIHTSTEMRDATESSVSLQIGEKKKTCLCNSETHGYMN